jgi:hypothetical protein
MAWKHSNPGSHIPQWVKHIVNTRQDDMCITIDPTKCWGTIDEYDHIINVKATGKTRRELDRDPNLLQGLCLPCHSVKTQAEARAGRQKRSGKRKPRPHPADALLNNKDSRS